MHKILFTAFIIINLASACFVKAETIVLKSGKIIQGSIIERGASAFKVDIGPAVLTYYFEDIESIDGEAVSEDGQEPLKNEPLEESGLSEEASHYAIAEKYAENGKFDMAIEEFKKALGLKPDFFEAYNSIGFCYIQLGRYEEAIKHFEKALEFNSDYAQAYDNIGVAYSFMKQFQKAISYYQKALFIDPEFSSSYNNLGATYMFSQQYPEAIESYKKFIELDEGNPDVYYNLGIAYYQIGQFQQAAISLQKARELYEEKGDSQGLNKVQEVLGNM
ncbi:MAG: tetratricopeptide repeat protein [Candidatus Omnitrophica bacterium]|nr:tetratricopeptide repeat protein [Candidatus Omnitrophota bacterium]MDD5430117.1 tetratricopeptide repeat protein [Candidatus Omnitrophota bacterium]